MLYCFTSSSFIGFVAGVIHWIVTDCYRVQAFRSQSLQIVRSGARRIAQNNYEHRLFQFVLTLVFGYVSQGSTKRKQLENYVQRAVDLEKSVFFFIKMFIFSCHLQL